jgi:hypothetical protein
VIAKAILPPFGVLLLYAAQSVTTAALRAQETQPVRQSLSDAWWTGPIIANSATTLPRGHFLIEPYFYDVHSAHSDSYASRSYVLYGLVDRFTVGFIPILGFNTAEGTPSSSHIQMGDLTLFTQYGLTKFHEGSWIPASSINIQQSLPTAKYDRLGDRINDGFGTGTFTTIVALNTQEYFWLPNGRILRMRFDVSGSFSTTALVEGVSVYGTTEGFRGKAKPGNSIFVDAAWEYSLTRHWVPALDVTYGYSDNTHVAGHTVLDSSGGRHRRRFVSDSGTSDSIGLVSALEYNFNANVGIIGGVRLIPWSRNTSSTVTPVFAINIAY